MSDEKRTKEKTKEEWLMAEIHDLKVDVSDLSQRIGHLLDRIIALENKG